MPKRLPPINFPPPPKPVDVTAGYRFYEKLGRPKFIVAPMVNQSELAFRMLTRKYNAELCYTPMIHAKMFLQDRKFRAKILDVHPEDRPIIAQICGHDPETLLRAALEIQPHVDAIDLNLGCPQNIARRGRYGAFLLEEVELVGRIVRTLHDGLDIPITCKIRVFPNDEDTLAMAKMLQEAGCAILTVHGRTKEMIKARIGPVNLDIIKQVKSSLSIPVFANGGIGTLEDVNRTLEYTGVDGIMTSEGILGYPALFHPNPVSPLQLANEYLEMVAKYPHASAQLAIRPHLFKILYRQLTHYSETRDWLADAEGPELPSVTTRIIEAEEKERKELQQDDVYQGDEIPIWYERFRDRENPDEAGECVEGVCGRKLTLHQRLAELKKKKQAPAAAAEAAAAASDGEDEVATTQMLMSVFNDDDDKQEKKEE